jgi:hypothetical protein
MGRPELRASPFPLIHGNRLGGLGCPSPGSPFRTQAADHFGEYVRSPGPHRPKGEFF